MTKPKIENLKCFKQVADVIGVANAKRELFKVACCKDCHFGRFKFTHTNLSKAFKWSGSPQDFVFWNQINAGINPYKEGE